MNGEYLQELGEPLTPEIVVFGVPAQQGSKKAFALKRAGAYTGRAVVVEDNKAKTLTWRSTVKDAVKPLIFCDCGDPKCVDRLPGFPVTGPVVGRFVFSFARPRSHYRTGRNAHLLSATAPARPSGKPDWDKLVRSVCDALTDVGLYKDDALIVEVNRVAKVFCGEDPEALDVPGARLQFWRAVDQLAVAEQAPLDEGQLELGALL